MTKRLFLIPALGALLFAVSTWGSGLASAQASTLTLRAGDGETGYAVNAFLPQSVTVTTGTTLKWNYNWAEPHSVTFGTPTGDPTAPTTPGAATVSYNGTGFVSSGLLPLGPPPASFGITFTKSGTYSYLCAIHPLMTGTVTVVDSGAADTQASLDTRGASEYGSALSALKAVASGLSAQPVAVTPLPGGAKKYTLAVGGGTAKGDDVQQFVPASVNINANDQVEWKSSSPTPHTVTFGPQPAGVPIPGNPAVDNVAKPAATFDGTGYWNSGVIGVNWPAGLTFSMTFAKAGTYQYRCLLHAAQGMVGTINVSPGAPGTGDSPGDLAASHHDSGLWLLAAAVLAISGVVAATTVSVRH